MESVLFLVFFLSFLGMLLTKRWFCYQSTGWHSICEPFKYFNNLIAMPIVLVLFLLGVVAVLAGIYLGAFKTSSKGIWYSGIGTILAVFSLFMLADSITQHFIHQHTT
ncbi:MAG: hypothetical protein R2771_15190 [Saprospiraceae bacterium]